MVCSFTKTIIEIRDNFNTRIARIYIRVDAFTYSTTDSEDVGNDDKDSDSDDENSDNDDENRNSDDENNVRSDEDEERGQLIRNYRDEIHRIITRGHRTLRIQRQGRRDWIIQSSRRNTLFCYTQIMKISSNFI
ncbi:hypothetical protein RCL_jg236.t1 [Rhizophagus clarus]|nr:hypothetical protein RCL_jg236.t1 [Rhizophagus clarus]